MQLVQVNKVSARVNIIFVIFILATTARTKRNDSCLSFIYFHISILRLFLSSEPVLSLCHASIAVNPLLDVLNLRTVKELRIFTSCVLTLG